MGISYESKLAKQLADEKREGTAEGFIFQKDEKNPRIHYDSQLAESLSKDWRGDNLVDLKAKGHKVEALDPKIAQAHRQAKEHLNALEDSDETEHGLNLDTHPLLPNLEGISPDHFIIPEEAYLGVVNADTAKANHEKKLRNRKKLNLKHSPKNKYKNKLSPKPTHTYKPRPF